MITYAFSEPREARLPDGYYIPLGCRSKRGVTLGKNHTSRGSRPLDYVASQYTRTRRGSTTVPRISAGLKPHHAVPIKRSKTSDLDSEITTWSLTIELGQIIIKRGAIEQQLGHSLKVIITLETRTNMSKAEREDAISAVVSRPTRGTYVEALTHYQTAKIFSAMVEDLTMDAALQAHHQLLRSRAVCRICHTRCVISQLSA